jgi:hypothetical protein
MRAQLVLVLAHPGRTVPEAEKGIKQEVLRSNNVQVEVGEEKQDGDYGSNSGRVEHTGEFGQMRVACTTKRDKCSPVQQPNQRCGIGAIADDD